MNPATIITSTTITFISSICLPAASELGLMIRDKMTEFRAKNLQNILKRCSGYIKYENGELQCDPRLMINIIEKASLCSDELMQDMWARLLASSCSNNSNDTNLIYVHILDQITACEANILNFICSDNEIVNDKDGTRVISTQKEYPLSELIERGHFQNFQDMEQQLDHMISLGLIPIAIAVDGGEYGKVEEKTKTMYLSFTPIGVAIYEKCIKER